MLSTLNFKTSLFEGILDNGEDSILLDNSKLYKIMENISSVVANPSEKQPTEDKVAIRPEDKEETIEPPTPEQEADSKREPTLFDSLSPDEEENKPKPEAPDAERLITQGISFLSGLAQTLKSPEATRKLAESLIEEDKESGQTTLRIPVADKESVINFFSLAGKLLAGLGEKK